MCDAVDVNQGSVTMGLTHFLPGGGCEYGANAKESIYYIMEGQMYLESEVGTPDEVKTTCMPAIAITAAPAPKSPSSTTAPFPARCWSSS